MSSKKGSNGSGISNSFSLSPLSWIVYRGASTGSSSHITSPGFELVSRLRHGVSHSISAASLLFTLLPYWLLTVSALTAAADGTGKGGVLVAYTRLY